MEPYAGRGSPSPPNGASRYRFVRSRRKTGYNAASMTLLSNNASESSESEPPRVRRRVAPLRFRFPSPAYRRGSTSSAPSSICPPPRHHHRRRDPPALSPAEPVVLDDLRPLERLEPRGVLLGVERVVGAHRLRAPVAAAPCDTCSRAPPGGRGASRGRRACRTSSASRARTRPGSARTCGGRRGAPEEPPGRRLVEEGVGGVVRGARSRRRRGAAGAELARKEDGFARGARGNDGGRGRGRGRTRIARGLELERAPLVLRHGARDPPRVPEAAARVWPVPPRADDLFSTTSSTSSRAVSLDDAGGTKCPGVASIAPPPGPSSRRAPLAPAPRRRRLAPRAATGDDGRRPRSLRASASVLRGRARRDRRHRRPRRGVAQQVRRGGDRVAPLVASSARTSTSPPRSRLPEDRGVRPRGRARRPVDRWSRTPSASADGASARSPVRARGAPLARHRRPRRERGGGAFNLRRNVRSGRAESGRGRDQVLRRPGQAGESRPLGEQQKLRQAASRLQGPGASRAATSPERSFWSLLPNFQTRANSSNTSFQMSLGTLSDDRFRASQR